MATGSNLKGFFNYYFLVCVLENSNLKVEKEETCKYLAIEWMRLFRGDFVSFAHHQMTDLEH